MEKLIFVYNADSGKWNAYLDMAHKVFSPNTYPCSLCDLTYGIFKIRPEWADFIQNAPMPFAFLHKDEFILQYPDLENTPLPVVLKVKNSLVETLIDKQELDDFKTMGDLKKRVLERLKY
jgi:hypothetical protein